MKSLCIVDLDGVLLDVSSRLYIAKSEGGGEGFWEIFFSKHLLRLDKPRRAGIEVVKRCLDNGSKILVLTGRPETLFEETVEQLEGLGMELGSRVFLLMRGRRGLRNPYTPPGFEPPRVFEKARAGIFKLSVIEALARIYTIAEIHEDDVEVLERASKIVPNALLILHEGDGFRIYRRGRVLDDFSAR